MLSGIADDVSLTVWRNPDELRAGLTSGSIDLSVVPAQAAANLYNRGLGIRLVNVMTNGLLYILAKEDAVEGGLAGLSGKSLAVPFPNDTPDFITRALLAREGITDQVELSTPATPMEAAQMLLAGRVDAAVLAEPVATVATLRAKQAGASLVRIVDLQQAWGAVTGLGPVVPQAGLAVTKAFSEAHGDLIEPLHNALVTATEDVLSKPQVAAEAAAEALDMPAPMLAASIPNCNLTATTASKARAPLEAMFNLMQEGNPDILGGKLPDDGFYAL
jgi:NitT/TauT family transport system substrate-binding protein